MHGDAELVERALGAIRNVFNDASVSPADTRERLELLRDEIDVSLAALMETDNGEIDTFSKARFDAFPETDPAPDSSRGDEGEPDFNPEAQNQ